MVEQDSFRCGNKAHRVLCLPRRDQVPHDPVSGVPKHSSVDPKARQAQRRSDISQLHDNHEQEGEEAHPRQRIVGSRKD